MHHISAQRALGATLPSGPLYVQRTSVAAPVVIPDAARKVARKTLHTIRISSFLPRYFAIRALRPSHIFATSTTEVQSSILQE
jgi:hypothetical protein